MRLLLQAIHDIKEVLMRPRAVAYAIFVLGLSARISCSAQLSVGEILAKVSETYRNLSSCRLVAESQKALASNGQQQSEGGGTMVMNFHQTVTSLIDLAVSPGKIRLVVKDQTDQPGGGVADKELLVVSDGQTTWGYTPRQKQYTEETRTSSEAQGASQPTRSPEMNALRQYWSLLVGRFREVQQFSPTATLGKEKRVKIGKEKVDCYVVKFQMEGITNELWVDKGRFLVLHLAQTPPRPQEGIAFQTAVTVNLTDVELNPQLPDELFKFTPPEQAMKVNSLKW